MTFSDQTDRAANSSLLAVAARVSGLAMAPLLVGAILGGLAILRDHDRAIIALQSEARIIQERQERQGTLIGDLFRSQTRSEVAVSGMISRQDAQKAQLDRIERILEVLASERRNDEGQ